MTSGLQSLLTAQQREIKNSKYIHQVNFNTIATQSENRMTTGKHG